MNDTAQVISLQEAILRREGVNVETWQCDRVACSHIFIARVKHDEEDPMRSCPKCGIRVYDNPLEEI